jgi:hypothetical protein
MFVLRDLRYLLADCRLQNQLLPGPTEILSSPAFGAPIPVFVIKVEDPQKVGDAIRGYTMYTVQTQVRILVTTIDSARLC